MARSRISTSPAISRQTFFDLESGALAKRRSVSVGKMAIASPASQRVRRVKQGP
jgi:hypothetical protein